MTFEVFKAEVEYVSPKKISNRAKVKLLARRQHIAPFLRSIM